MFSIEVTLESGDHGVHGSPAEPFRRLEASLNLLLAAKSSCVPTYQLLNLETSLALGNIVKNFRVNHAAAVKHHAQKTRAAGDPMGDAARHHRRLTGVEFHGAPFGVIERVAAELKPDLVLVAASVKAALFFFQIVNVDSELLAVVKHRRSGAAFAGHAGEIIERRDLLHR